MDSLEQIALIDLNSTYGLVVGMTLWGFDWLLTLHQEMDYVWYSKWTPGKVLYVSVRYNGFMTLVFYLYVVAGAYVTPLSCKVTLYIALILQVCVIGAASVILALRTWAIWNRTKAIAAILGIAWLSFVAASLTFSVMAIQNLTPSNLGLGLRGCSGTNTPASSEAAQRIYITLGSYEGLIFLMTCARGVPMRNTLPKLTRTLYRDAFVASICLLTLAIVNAVLARSNQPVYYLTYFISLALSSVLPARIILNIREATRDLDDWDMTSTMKTPMHTGFGRSTGFDRSEPGEADDEQDGA